MWDRGWGESGQVPFLLAEEGMEPDDLLCSRNARPPKALVGRAQWKINQPPSLKRERAGLEGWGESGQVPFLLAERAHSERARLGQERVSARSGLGGRECCAQ